MTIDLNKKLFSVPEVIQICSLGRTSIYNAINDNRLCARKFGSKTLITLESLEDFINNLPTKENVGGQSEQQ